MLTIWSLHWVVADAFDDAQVCLPGETEGVDQRDRNAPKPWFVRSSSGAPLPGSSAAAAPLRALRQAGVGLAGEIEVMEAHKAITAGFAISTAALLATPVLNLLFRPIILAGSSHLLGQLEKGEHRHHLSEAGTRTSALSK